MKDNSDKKFVINKSNINALMDNVNHEVSMAFPNLHFEKEYPNENDIDNFGRTSFILIWKGKIVVFRIGVYFDNNWKAPRYFADIWTDYKNKWGKVYFWQRLNQSLPIVLSRLKEFIHTKMSLLHEDLSQF